MSHRNLHKILFTFKIVFYFENYFIDYFIAIKQHNFVIMKTTNSNRDNNVEIFIILILNGCHYIADINV